MSDVCPLCDAERARVVYETDAQMFWVVAVPGLTDRFAPVRLRQCVACGHVFNRELADETIAEIYRRQTATNRPVSVTSVILVFFLFRLFDITKPPPARRLERLGGGMGIVMDDVAAGVYANIVLQVVVRDVL